jgi:predicted metal-binding membrane protein
MLEQTLRRDRLTVLVGLAAITLLSWAYMFYLGWQMNQMDMGAMNMGDMGMEMAMPQTEAWTTTEFLLTFVMWAVMMVAMMIPSAAPMITTYAAVSRKRDASRQPFGPTAIFVLGYLIVWTVFSLLATTAQWALHSAALLSPMMVTTSAVLGAALLIAAGIFQFTPLKHACLHHCRSPISFFLTDWRDGRLGALQMGAKHGTYCLGCCWFLMALLFVAGVMNLLWVAVLAGLVLLEKVLPNGPAVARVAGVGFIVWGLWLAAGALYV